MNVEQLIDKTLEDKDDSLKLHFKLNEVHKSLAQKYNLTANIINLVNFGFKIVASVILVVCFVRAHYIDKVKYNKLEKHQLITYYFKHNLSSSLRGGNTPDREIASLLDEHQYNEAITFLKSLPQNEDKPGLLLYIGYANMCAGNYQVAEKHFVELMEPQTVYSELAEYYLAGNYILSNNIKKAKETLKDIIVQKGYYTTKSKSLLYYIND